MKKLSELTDFYYEVLFPTLKQLESDRKSLRYRIIVIAAIYTIITLSLIFPFLDFFLQNLNGLIFVAFIYLGLGGFIYKILTKDYTTEFKEKIIRPLINEIDNNLRYTPELSIPQTLFERSKLFTSQPDRYNGNDFVRGSIDKIPIQFSDVHAEKRHKNSKGNDNWETIFQGIFIAAEFNKHFHGETVVLPDSAQSTFGNLIGSWLQSKNLSRDELVKLDHVEFEKEFVVYSTDQVEARYILSHSLMHRLLSFQKRSSHPVHISFIGGSIHIAIEYNKDLFEPSIFHSLLDYKIAMEYLQTLHLAIGIIDELKLNEKLWSKQ